MIKLDICLDGEGEIEPMTGIWILILVIHTGPHQIETMPLIAYPDPMFGFHECRQDKENLSKKLKYEFACVRMSSI